MSGKMRTPGVDNPHGPGKRSQHDRERTDKDAGAGVQRAAAHQEADAAESQQDSCQKRRIQAPSPGGDCGEQEHPDGLAGYEQRGKARRDFLLRPVKRAVANEKKEKADDDAGANLRPGGSQTFCQAPREENCPGDQVAEACGVQRWNRFHGVTNRKVRGTPDKVDGKKGKGNGGANFGSAAARSSCCNVLSLLYSLRQHRRLLVTSQVHLKHYDEIGSRHLPREWVRQGCPLGGSRQQRRMGWLWEAHRSACEPTVACHVP